MNDSSPAQKKGTTRKGKGSRLSKAASDCSRRQKFRALIQRVAEQSVKSLKADLMQDFTPEAREEFEQELQDFLSKFTPLNNQ